MSKKQIGYNCCHYVRRGTGGCALHPKRSCGTLTPACEDFQEWAEPEKEAPEETIAVPAEEMIIQPVDEPVEAKAKAKATAEPMKHCSKCNQDKPVSEFGKHAGTKDGLYYCCNDCRRALQKGYNAIWYQRNKAKNNPDAKRKYPVKKTTTPATKTEAVESSNLKAYTDEQILQELKARGYTGEMTKTVRFTL